MPETTPKCVLKYNMLPTREIDPALVERFELDVGTVYALPSSLLSNSLSSLARTLGEEPREWELRLSRIADQWGCIGFEQCEPINHLRVRPFQPITANMLSSFHDTPESAAKRLSEIMLRMHEVSQGYMGWLLAQPAFQGELSAVTAGFSNLPRPSIGMLQTPIPQSEDGSRALSYRDFCARWRIQQMVTRDLPIAVEPQYTPGPFGQRLPTIAPPDIYPIDGSGLYAEVTEGARSTSIPPHLEGWNEIICAGSHKKKAIKTWARRFQLQHYWRVLFDRNAEKLVRKRGHVYDAFATYLKTSRDSIERDVTDPAFEPLLERPLAG